MVSLMSLIRCISLSEVELAVGGFATNRATPSSFTNDWSLQKSIFCLSFGMRGEGVGSCCFFDYLISPLLIRRGRKVEASVAVAS